MRTLTLSQLRFLRFAPWSTLTVLLGVTLAVASIVAVHQISRLVVESLAGVMPPFLEDVAYLLERPDLDMDDYFELRARWRRGELPEVAGLMPLVDGSVATGDASLHLVGVDGFSGVRAVAALALLPPGTVVVGSDPDRDRQEAILLNGHRYPIARVNDGVPAGMVVTDIGTAQVILGRDDEALDRVAVVLDSGSRRLVLWGDQLLPGLSAGLRLPPWSLPGWEVHPVESELPDLAFARSVLFNLGALGSLALVVAWLLVYQVGVIWLRRRQLTLTRLRQMGVTEGELRRGFLLSLLCLGAIAAAMGVGAGTLLARGLTGAVTGYGTVGGATPVLDGWVVGKALGSALLVCLVGGWFAYRRESGARSPAAVAALVPVGVLVAGMAGLASDSLAGGFLAIASLALLVLLLISPLLRRLERGSRVIGGSLLVRSGVRELFRYPADLAVAIGALVLALATSVAIASMIDSFRGDFERMLDQRLAHDLFVDGQGRDLSELALILSGVRGVIRVQRYGSQEARLLGRSVEVGYTRFDARESARYGLDTPLAPGSAIVSERLARAAGVAVGDALDGTGLTVAGIFPGFGDPMPRLLVDDADAQRLGVPLVHTRLSVDTTAPEQVLRVAARTPGEVTVTDRQSVRNRALSIFDQTFAITRALTLLALLVAAVGLYNALLALALLRQPTGVLLNALGVSGSEQRWIDAGRTLGVCLLVLLLAVPLGLVMGGLLCEVINPRAFGWSLTLAPGAGAVLEPVAIAVAVMVLVALLPVPAEAVPDAD